MIVKQERYYTDPEKLRRSRRPEARFNGVNVVKNENEYEKILREFPEITDQELATTTTAHGVQCFIPMAGPPLKTPPQRLTPEKLAIAKQHFKLMCASGICR